MTISNLKELQKVIQACRKLGVQAIKIDNVEFNLGPLPRKNAINDKVSNDDFPEASIPVPAYNGTPMYTSPAINDTQPYTDDTYTQQLIDTPDELTEDQLLFYSARPEEAGQ